MFASEKLQMHNLLRQEAVQSLQACSNVLLIIAHPDDESMFFAPTLNYLHSHGVVIYVLCLSNGNGDGLGKVREKELIAACKVLKIPESRVSLVDDPQLQDGMCVSWPSEAVAQQVEQQLRRHPCDTLLTFDAHGVSGHINHQGVHHGVRLLLEQNGHFLGVRQGWQLVSECLLHKFSCLLSVPLLLLNKERGQALVLGGRPWSSLQAMAAHRSQWVWYRKLFVLLSSYTYVNRLQPMTVGVTQAG